MSDAGRLPRGRHGMSRADVAADQRTRILSALARTMAERGYVDTPVAAVLHAAGVSRETFYQLFESKQDCLAAALTATIDRLAGDIRDVIVRDPGPPLDTFGRLLAKYLAALADAPETARLFLIETYAAGSAAMQQRLALQRQFVDGLAAMFDARTDGDRFACEALVATVVSTVTAHFVSGAPPEELAAVRAPLVELAGRLLVRG